jgi:hypothetical protein
MLAAVTYIDYERFENSVADYTTGEHYTRYRHLLPYVDLLQRNRFLQTVQQSTDIAHAVQIFTAARNLPDKHYFRYLRFALNKLR